MRESVAFIGVGNMGAPMADNLVGAGVAVRAYDVRPERREAARGFGAEPAATIADAAAPGGIAISMVPDDEALERIALATGGVLASLGKGGVHLSMSTVSPELSERLETRYLEVGCTYLAATVLGRPDVANDARLSIFIAGAEAAKRRVWPLLEIMGRRIYDFGDRATAANVVKVAANFLIMSAIEAMAESAAVLDRYAVDRADFLRMIAESPLFGGAVFEGYGAMIAADRYQPALFPAALGLKDAELALATARRAGLGLPLAELVRENLLAALDAGWGDEDWGVIGRVVASNGGPR